MRCSEVGKCSVTASIRFVVGAREQNVDENMKRNKTAQINHKSLEGVICKLANQETIQIWVICLLANLYATKLNYFCNTLRICELKF